MALLHQQIQKQGKIKTPYKKKIQEEKRKKALDDPSSHINLTRNILNSQYNVPLPNINNLKKIGEKNKSSTSITFDRIMTQGRLQKGSEMPLVNLLFNNINILYINIRLFKVQERR